MNILLDTNAYSRLKRDDEEVIKKVLDADQVLISAIVAGELFYGFRVGSKTEANCIELMNFLDHPKVHVVPISFQTAEHYGKIASALRSMGRPIPPNDMWIAAQAIETDSELVTADSDFEFIDGLRCHKLAI